MKSDNGILYIEPSKNVSSTPLIDAATKKMTAALRLGKRGQGYRGHHDCACGAHSDNCDFTLPNGEQTNSLSIHYLAYHRSDVPQAQLEKVLELDFGEAEPTAEEMSAGMKTEITGEFRDQRDRFRMR